MVLDSINSHLYLTTSTKKNISHVLGAVWHLNNLTSSVRMCGLHFFWLWLYQVNYAMLDAQDFLKE